MKDTPFLMQSHDDSVDLLIERNKCAFVLMTVIARRARRADCPISGLKAGQAYLGDYKKYDMTEREYRTAKEVIRTTGLATFHATNRGTVATIANTTIYNINKIGNDEPADRQSDRQTTGQRQASDGQTTTNNKERKEEGKNEINTEPPTPEGEVYKKAGEENSPPKPTKPKQQKLLDIPIEFPTAEQTISYGETIEMNTLESKEFWAYWEERKWARKDGKKLVPVADWKATMRTWQARLAKNKAEMATRYGRMPISGARTLNGNLAGEIFENKQARAIEID